MIAPSTVIPLLDFEKPLEFSSYTQSDAKIPSQSDSTKTLKTPGNIDLSTTPDLAPVGELEGKVKSSGPTKKKFSKAQVPLEPSPLPSTGSDGCKADCAAMTPGQLHAAYKSEYQSWKGSKSRCKKKAWPWASEWGASRASC